MGLFKKKEENKLSGSVVAIQIYKLFGENTPIIVTEFEAIQEKDDSYTLNIIGDGGKFKEPVEILKSNIIQMLRYKLDFSGKTKDKRIQIVKENIENQEAKIKDLRKNNFIEEVKNEKTGEVEKVQVNEIDEVNKLTQLKILLDSVQNEGRGSFESINSKGQRQLSYMLIDGMLFPIFYNATKHTMYPANDTKKKIHREESINLKDEYQEEIGGGGMGVFSMVLKIALVVLLISGLGWNFYNAKLTVDLGKSIENSDLVRLERSATESQLQITECNVKFTSLLTKYNSCIWNMTNSEFKETQAHPNEYIEKVIDLN